MATRPVHLRMHAARVSHVQYMPMGRTRSRPVRNRTHPAGAEPGKNAASNGNEASPPTNARRESFTRSVYAYGANTEQAGEKSHSSCQIGRASCTGRSKG